MAHLNAPSPEALRRLPDRPGVYVFRSASGEVLYVGKAKSLRSRVRSYFRADPGRDTKTHELVRQVATFEVMVVGSEMEALILEANLIKEHRPRFNLQLRDDKKYPYVKVTLDEPFPRVFVTRLVRNDGARYFGPFTSVGPLRQALDVVRRLYTVRSCRYDLPREAPDRPCLDYHIGRCLAPCVGLQSEAEYREMVAEILRILEGDTERLREETMDRLRAASEGLRFEEAARLRDVVRGLDTIARQQRVHKVGGGDQDVLAVARDGPVAAAVALRIRRGLLLGWDTLRFHDVAQEGSQSLISAFATRYYLGRGEEGALDTPQDILLAEDFPDRPLLEAVLTKRSGHKVRLSIPRRGNRRRLLELAEANARQALDDGGTPEPQHRRGRADEALFELQDRLDMKILPRSITCFDISHLQGEATVASVVVFENGTPKKSEYRHMRIRGEWGNDDVRSMAEALDRYFTRRRAEERPMPDLVVVDGGRPQLNAALAALARLGLEGLPLIALAKKEEQIYRPGLPAPLELSRRDPALHLLQRLRDEAHRFAITYNRKLRIRSGLQSRLGQIPGVGPKREQALLSRFGSLERLRHADPKEVARVPGIGMGLALRILTYLRR